MYIDVPEKPDGILHTFLDNSHIKLEWRAVDVAEYFIISQNGSTQETFLVNDTSVLIEYNGETTVQISAINECHMKSPEGYLLIKRGIIKLS